MGEPTILDADAKLNVKYCIPFWLRDEQVRVNTARKILRIEAVEALRDESVAVVCYGPSLAETWEQIRGFKYVISCSGAHRFLVERGIVPTWHVEVDPRAHKISLIGDPHPDVEYLIASTCHPDLFEYLAGFRVRLWHVFDNTDDAKRLLPPTEWAITGGASVGLRALAMARFFGFLDLHVFGMDGNEGTTGKHAAAHPNQAPGHALVEYPKGSGAWFRTTGSMLECARQTWHELDQMCDPPVTATFYGEGLVQAMAKDYVRKPARNSFLGFCKPELISAGYRDLNAQLHQSNLAYGVKGDRHADVVSKIVAGVKDPKYPSVLDYGCGKGSLAKALPFPIWEYDPAIPEKSQSPRPADVVVCTDVLEHIEPDKLLFVLDDLRRCVKQVGFFTIHTGAAQKTLPDGRNTHLIQEGMGWWRSRLEEFFTVGQMLQAGKELYVVVGPKRMAKAAAA